MRLLIVTLVTLWQSNVVMENPPLTSYQPPFLVDFPIFSYDFVQLETSFTLDFQIYIYIHISHIWLVVSTPLKNMKVSWDDYSQPDIYTDIPIGRPEGHPDS